MHDGSPPPLSLKNLPHIFPSYLSLISLPHISPSHLSLPQAVHDGLGAIDGGLLKMLVMQVTLSGPIQTLSSPYIVPI